jgi:hypothetical protein
VLDDADPAHPLQNGLSATVDVDTGYQKPLLRWLRRHFGGEAPGYTASASGASARAGE